MHASKAAHLEADRYAYEFLTRVQIDSGEESSEEGGEGGGGSGGSVGGDAGSGAGRGRQVLVASLRDGCEVQYINDHRGSGESARLDGARGLGFRV